MGGGWIYLVVGLTLVNLCQCIDVNVTSHTDVNIQLQAVKDLIKRTLPNDWYKFHVSIDPTLGPRFRSTFSLHTAARGVTIVGNDGVAAAWGFHHYLKHYCHCQITWEGRQVKVPRELPQLPAEGVRVTSKDQFRYYGNVCTFSYSFVWWNWTRWESHIDWIAMNGLNLPLAFTGQEAIWRKVYMKLGLSQREMDSHFSGPAFLAWSRMGNIRTWGGPLPNSWYSEQLALQKRILTRMREFGMIPVLPGFAGHVPDEILRVYPDAAVTRLNTWSHFNTTYSATLILDARSALFQRIGTMFMEEMTSEFGSDHVYNADPFNEMIPSSSNITYLRHFARGVFSAMTRSDPRAVWMVQAWMFDFSKTFWQEPQVRAFVTSVPIGKMIVLDLFSEQKPMYNKFKSYYGQPFIWCMLLNFGGVLGYYGQINNVNTGPSQARAMVNSSMVGVGLTMEGIFQNYVMFDFMLEKAYRDDVNVSRWMALYSRRRYGKTVRKLELFWQTAAESVFNCNATLKDHGQSILMKRPNLHAKPFIWYSPRSILFMWRKALQAASVTSGTMIQYDLVDITRQALTVSAVKIYHKIVTAYRRKDIENLERSGQALLQLLTDLDEILRSNEHYLLGQWIHDARALGGNQTERNLYEFNARNQITLWGPNGEILDYAKKQWSGLINDYYKPRWRLFLTFLTRALATGRKFNHDEFKIAALNDVERPFSYSRKIYPTTAAGDPLTISGRLCRTYDKYLRSPTIPSFPNRSRPVRRAEPRRRKHKHRNV